MAKEKIKCGRCGKTLLYYDSAAHMRKYQSPVKQCKGCGSRYADPRCHELAVEGLPKDAFSIPSYIFLVIFGAFLLYRGVHLLQGYQLGVPRSMQWLLPVVFILFGLIMFIGGLIEIITIKTGLKEKKYRKLLEESEIRLSDKSYAYLLRDLGYRVPEKYL